MRWNRSIENKIAKASTMIANGADELRSGIGQGRASVATGAVGARLGRRPTEGVLRAVP